ncbi:MAG: hypothetical protein GY750_15555, partial [Lentisphaerae bacterium]|nr:hypothetical protein [Lentisphaerota bacterium]
MRRLLLARPRRLNQPADLSRDGPTARSDFTGHRCGGRGRNRYHDVRSDSEDRYSPIGRRDVRGSRDG